MKAWLEEHYFLIGWLCLIGLALGYGAAESHSGCRLRPPTEVFK